MTRRFCIPVLCIALAAPVLAYDVPGMRDAMRLVFSSMRVLLELSASPENLADPANERAILGATNELADQAAIVSEHAPRDEASFLAGSLDRYAGWIRRSYDWRRYDAMARLVYDSVNLCVACHTRLPSRHDSRIANDFLAGSDMEALPADQRARLQIATRRFDDALDTLERVLAGLGPGEAFDNTLRTYLVVAVRVKGDPARARRILDGLIKAGRFGEAGYLRALSGALQHQEIDPPTVGDLDAARTLIREAEARLAADRGLALVDYIAASRVLYEFSEAGAGTVAEGAEAYYLQGLAQYRIEKSAWLPQAELFLEKAIRTAPASESARRALALLQTKVNESFSAQGERMPEDVVKHMNMLREMVEAGG